MSDPVGDDVSVKSAIASVGGMAGRCVVLGVTGSIASYKAIEVASRLVQAGATVDVAMTPSATEFVVPLTFRSITGREPYVEMFTAGGEPGEAHVELARRADLMLIAPATATTMARLAHGLAEDFVSLTALATRAPLLVAPAMDVQMWEHSATRANVETLSARGVDLVGPSEGRLASGRTGIGRLVDPAVLVAAVRTRLGRESGDLVGRRVVVTAGGTREPLDPVRYLGNRSSGRMGYALTEAARDRGASVVLVSTVTSQLPPPYGVRIVPVESASEMFDAVRAHALDADALLMAAAVADFRPRAPVEQKVKRAIVSAEGSPTVELVENPDIIASIEGACVKVSFAAETLAMGSEELRAEALRKLHAKSAQLVVANDVTAAGAGFGSLTNRVSILDEDGNVEELPLLPKYDCAWRILDRVAVLLRG